MRRLNPDLVNMLHTWGSHESKRTGLEFPSSTTIGKMLCSPGISTATGSGPNYEPDMVARRVNVAICQICFQDHDLLLIRYRDGMSDWAISTRIGSTRGKVRWALEIAHRNISLKLKIPVYR